MRNDHELLHLYLGDEMFDEMGHAYVKARPSEHPNLRWFSQGLPEFLKSTEPYCNHPVLSDLAALEKALNDAFDAAEGAVLELTAMAGVCAGGVARPQIPAASQCDAGSISRPMRRRSGWRSRTTRRRRTRPHWTSRRGC